MTKENKTLNSNLTLYDVNKQLLNNERFLDPIELNLKIKTIRKAYDNKTLKFLMLLCNERKDYTIFDLKNFTKEKDLCLNEFESDLRESLQNRGRVLTIEKAVSSPGWEIWLRDDEGENFCYYLFNCTPAVLSY